MFAWVEHDNHINDEKFHYSVKRSSLRFHIFKLMILFQVMTQLNNIKVLRFFIIILDIRNATCNMLILQWVIIKHLYMCLSYTQILLHNNEIIYMIIVGCCICYYCVSFNSKRFKVKKNIRIKINVLWILSLFISFD